MCTRPLIYDQRPSRRQKWLKSVKTLSRLTQYQKQIWHISWLIYSIHQITFNCHCGYTIWETQKIKTIHFYTNSSFSLHMQWVETQTWNEYFQSHHLLTKNDTIRTLRKTRSGTQKCWSSFHNSDSGGSKWSGTNTIPSIFRQIAKNNSELLPKRITQRFALVKTCIIGWGVILISQ